MEESRFKIGPESNVGGPHLGNVELTIYVVPCGAAKLDHAAPAAELYIGAQFRYVLNAALELADANRNRVRILSALHGLLELDTVVEPYDMKMDHAASVASWTVRKQLEDIKPNANLHLIALTPNAYSDQLDAAINDSTSPMQGVRLTTAFAGCRGVGEQRGRVAKLVRAYRSAQCRDT